MACSDQGGEVRTAGTAHVLTTVWSVRIEMLTVVAERVWLRRRPFLGGERASQGQRKLRTRGWAGREQACDDTVLVIGKRKEEKEQNGKQPGVLKCGSTGWIEENKQGDETHGKPGFVCSQ